jgi:hypothetical protein
MLKTFFDWLGYVSSVIVLIGIVWGFIQWLRGIIPLSIRASKIQNNKVAVFAKGANITELTDSMNGTKLFGKNSFKEVSSIGNITACEGSRIFVVHWGDWGSEIDAILLKKTADTGVIVYAPHGVTVPGPDMAKLQNHNFITLTNFRGRLINDLLAMAIAIRYAKK